MHMIMHVMRHNSEVAFTTRLRGIITNKNINKVWKQKQC